MQGGKPRPRMSARPPAVKNALADLSLVLIHLRRIDVAESGFQGLTNILSGRLSAQRPCADANLRNLNVVVESNHHLIVYF